MEIRLVIERGGASPQVIRLQRAVTIIGRQKGCDLRIPSALVSRRHCRLTTEDDCLVLEDLGSANGSLVNGVRAQGKQVVRPGDRVDIGPLRFRVEYALTQTAIDRLLREAPEKVVELAEDEEQVFEVEVLDSTSDDAVTLATDEEMQAVELVEEEETPAPAASDESVVRFDEDENWRLPAGDDVRDILSKLEEGEK